MPNNLDLPVSASVTTSSVAPSVESVIIPIEAAAQSAEARSLRLSKIAAFAAIYLIWGSTYLAIRFAIETVPPFFMAGTRFVLAGGGLYLWMRLRGGAPRPTRRQWVATGIAGALMLFTGNGMVVWAEQRVTSSVVSLLLAMTPVWMTLLDWWRPGGVRPNRGETLGLGLGVLGIVLLIGPSKFTTGAPIDLLGAAVVLIAALSWAAGSIYSRHAPLPSSPRLATSMEMLVGGALLLGASLATGDAARADLLHISLRSALAYLYLIVFGSLIAFSAYVWLLKHSAPSRVATYAYVNPVIAVFLGWALASEPLTWQTLLAAAIIIGAVALIISNKRPATG